MLAHWQWGGGWSQYQRQKKHWHLYWYWGNERIISWRYWRVVRKSGRLPLCCHCDCTLIKKAGSLSRLLAGIFFLAGNMFPLVGCTVVASVPNPEFSRFYPLLGWNSSKIFVGLPQLGVFRYSYWIALLGGYFIPKHWIKYPSRAGTLFQAGQRKNLFRVVFFSRIKKERFLRNPGIILTFLTV